jgi:polysaccharide export outer membrane protein
MRNEWIRVCGILFALTSGSGVCTAQGKDEIAGRGPQSPGEQATATQTLAGDRSDLEKRNPRYLVRSSDVLEISFPITREFDQTETVQPDGYIRLRGAGDVYVEGKSVPEIIEALKVAYAKILHDPVIDVLLKDFEKPFFIAGGQVSRPGKYELRGDLTVTEAVQIAGGFTDKSKHSKVVVYRRVPQGWVDVKRLDVKQMLAHNDLTEDIHLHPGDMIYVPQNGISKIKSFLPSTGLGMSMPVP